MPAIALLKIFDVKERCIKICRATTVLGLPPAPDVHPRLPLCGAGEPATGAGGQGAPRLGRSPRRRGGRSSSWRN
jgi:hypothetical protein